MNSAVIEVIYGQMFVRKEISPRKKNLWLIIYWQCLWPR